MRLPYDGSFPISQFFGENPEMYKPFGLSGHNGIDFAIPTGNRIVTPHGGIVKEAYFDENGYGNYVKIENATEGSVLGHLLSISVKIGQALIEGDTIGISDNTGWSTGAHLHWGYYKFPRDRSNGYNGFIDQYPIIKPLMVQEGVMTIEKKVFEELITKLDKQDKLIASLNEEIALCKDEVNKKLSAQREDIKNKIIALIDSLS